jgi:hypothetical protein
VIIYDIVLPGGEGKGFPEEVGVHSPNPNERPETNAGFESG